MNILPNAPRGEGSHYKDFWSKFSKIRILRTKRLLNTSYSLKKLGKQESTKYQLTKNKDFVEEYLPMSFALLCLSLCIFSEG